MFAKKALIFSLSVMASAPTMAHSIFLDCAAKEAKVECKGSFSDGSSASNLPVEVISYEDEVLAQGNTGKDSSFTFNLPEEDYYILMDAGPGHVVEVDMQDAL